MVEANHSSELSFEQGETVEISRSGYLNPELYNDPKDRAFAEFFHSIAQDPNIEGVAISKINYGGIYTHWFTRQLLDNHEASRRSLEVTGGSYSHLKAASGDQTGYASFITLGERSFDEVEKKFRDDWEVVPENDYFGRGANSEDLELVGIFKFVD